MDRLSIFFLGSFLFISFLTQYFASDESSFEPGLQNDLHQLNSRTIQENKRIIKQQQLQIDQQATLLQEYRHELRQQSDRIKFLEDKLSRHDVDVTEQAKEDVEPDEDMGMEQTESMNEVLPEKRKATMRILNRVAKDLEGPVGFHATNDKAATVNIGIHQHIIYEDVHLNLGNGFHELHGLFIAPMGGIYMFSTSILSYVNSQSQIIVSIMKNGAALGRAYAHGDSGRHDQGSVTVLVQLAVGDEVWVESSYVATTAEYGDKYTSFMGYLLYQM